MPILGNALDFAKYEGRNFRGHQLGSAPSSPVTGQLYYNTGDNTLYWWDGSGWVSARGGASATPPATTSSLGTIQLAGDLAGTATSPQIAAGVITDVDVNALNKDGGPSTPSMRTIGTGAQQAMAGNTRHDQIAAPTLDVDWNNKKITTLGNPVNGQDAANKQYVDTVAQGLNAKQSCRASTTANITLSGTQTVDGVALIAGDRILVKDQTTQTQNGIYVVAAGTWNRSLDADAGSELVDAYTFIEEGTTNADTGWVQTTNAPIVTGTTNIVWTQFSGAGSIIAGGGLTKTGNQLDVGAGAGITVNADTIQVANGGITATMMASGSVILGSTTTTGTVPVANGGTGAIAAPAARNNLGAAGFYNQLVSAGTTTTTITQATHGLSASRAKVVQVVDNSTGAVELPDIVCATNGDVTITWGAATANQKVVTIIG